MPADYKNRSRKPAAERRSPGWLWFIAGLLSGVFAMFLLCLELGGLGNDEASRAVTPKPPASTPLASKAPAVKQKPPASKPRFEFYDLLPDMEVPVTDVQVEPKRGSGEGSSHVYLLQIASFKQHEEADKLRARLALLGIESHTQAVTIDGRATWHRVRSGPYDSLREMEKTRNRLRNEGLNPMPLKIGQ